MENLLIKIKSPKKALAVKQFLVSMDVPFEVAPPLTKSAGSDHLDKVTGKPSVYSKPFNEKMRKAQKEVKEGRTSAVSVREFKNLLGSHAPSWRGAERRSHPSLAKNSFLLRDTCF